MFKTIQKSVDTVGFWRRLAAFFADIAIIQLIILWPFQKVFVSYLGITFGDQILSINENAPSTLYFLILIVFLLVLLYFTFFDYYISQTPGMMLFNMRVIDTNNPKSEQVSFWKSIVRNLFVLPFFPFYILWIMEPVYLAIYKERFLERITGTKTVNQNFVSYNTYKLKKVV